MTQTLIASIERAGDHVVVVGVLAGAGGIAALAYWLVQLVGKRQDRRSRPDDDSHGARSPEA